MSDGYSEALLQTHAEVAIALAGFASVIAALGRPLSPFARQRFFSLLSLSLIQIVGCLLPLWILHLVESPSVGWRLLSAFLLALSAARMGWLIVMPSRTLGAEVLRVLHPAVARFIYPAFILSGALLTLNVIGVGFRPNFDVYYFALLTNLFVGFALFADVATRES
jgi:hypothetical protein